MTKPPITGAALAMIRAASEPPTLSEAKRATESFSDVTLIAEGARRFAAANDRPKGGQSAQQFPDTVLLGMLASRLAALRAEVAALTKEHELFVDTVRLVGKSSWDAPGWTLHVPHERATLLFDVAYGHVADPKPTESTDERAIRERLKSLRAARSSAAGEDTDG